MLLTLFLTCAVALGLNAILLVALGHRVRNAFRPLGLLLALAVTLLAGEVASSIWQLPPGYVEAGEIALLAVTGLVVLVRPQWNPIGQAFYGAFLTSVLAYLAFGLYVTFGTGLSIPAMLASGILFLFELVALGLSSSFAFESLDVTTRLRWPRPIPDPDPEHRPFVSLQIAAYNEPPDMLIQTIRSVEAMDYPNFEIVVIDNNTTDPEVWQPVEEYCRDRERVSFVHV